jgi:hypothetical protein
MEPSPLVNVTGPERSCIGSSLGLSSAFQLFNPTATTEGALLHLEKSIMSNIEQVVAVTIKKTLADELKSK